MDKFKKRRIALYCSVLMIALTGCATTVVGLSNPSTDYVPDEQKTITKSNIIPTSYEQHTDVQRTPDGIPICPTCGQMIYAPKHFLTSTEVNLLATVVELEAGGEGYDCKKATASVILNRMTLDNKTLTEVIYADNQFEVIDEIEYATPSEDTLNAVKEVVRYGVNIPEYVTFFRADNYHEWGDLQHFVRLDNTYFSYSEAIKEQCESAQ